MCRVFFGLSGLGSFAERGVFFFLGGEVKGRGWFSDKKMFCKELLYSV